MNDTISQRYMLISRPLALYQRKIRKIFAYNYFKFLLWDTMHVFIWLVVALNITILRQGILPIDDTELFPSLQAVSYFAQ